MNQAKSQPMNNQKITSSPSSATNNHNKRIDALFARFAAFYGHVWRSQFKSEWSLDFTKKEWDEGLNVFSDEVINKAAVHCRDFCEMPPTLPQVIILCRQIKKRSEFYVANTDHKPATAAVVNLHLSRCKALLIPQ